VKTPTLEKDTDLGEEAEETFPVSPDLSQPENLLEKIAYRKFGEDADPG
jgi:hypothetical protein